MDGLLFVIIGTPLVAFSACTVYRAMMIMLMSHFPGFIPVVRVSSIIVLSLVPVELTLAVFLEHPLIEYRLGAALIALVFWLSPPALAGLLALPPAETSSNTVAAGAICAVFASFCLLWTSMLMDERRPTSPRPVGILLPETVGPYSSA